MIREYFKNIDSEEKAYWLGFLCADGCVSSNYKQLIVDLHIRDYNHIENFKRAINSTAKIKIHGNENQYARISIYCKELCIDLSKCECTPRKSLTLKYPNRNILKKEFEKDFIRGYFDGDGCLSFSSTYQYRKDRKIGKKYLKQCWFFKIIGTKEFLSGIQKFLPVKTSIKQLDKEKNNCYIKCGGNQKIKNIMDSFYKNSNIFLDRKYNLYLKLKNYKTKSQEDVL